MVSATRKRKDGQALHRGHFTMFFVK